MTGGKWDYWPTFVINFKNKSCDIYIPNLILAPRPQIYPKLVVLMYQVIWIQDSISIIKMNVSIKAYWASPYSFPNCCNPWHKQYSAAEELEQMWLSFGWRWLRRRVAWKTQNFCCQPFLLQQCPRIFSMVNASTATGDWTFQTWLLGS